MATTRVLSREDGNLNTTSLLTSRNKVYRDIDLSFLPKPNGDIYVKRDAAAVKQAVKTLVQTNHFEKPFLPFFGSDIRSLLFELAYDDTADDIIENITSTIELYEPRAKIIDIKVTARPDNNSIDLTIEFQVISTEEVVVFSTVVSRLR